MLDFDVIDSWYAEPKRMNYGKKDVQYYYPNPFVELLGYMRIYIFIYHTNKLKVLSDLTLTKRYPQYQITIRLTGVSIILISKSTKRLIMTL